MVREEVSADIMPFQIKIPVFEGPFDLLLFFIERDELDIYNIPIAKITADFLDYIRQMELMNIDLASEFIVVAATLMKIKARMLLPRKELDELQQEIDPRDELTRKLVEYRKYREVIDELAEMEAERAKKFARGNISAELKVLTQKAMLDAEWESLTLYGLLKAFEKVMNRFQQDQSKTVHQIRQYEYSIHGQQDYILEKVQLGMKADFAILFEQLENRIHAIITFLALLELLNLQMIHIIQGEGTNNFWVTSVEHDTHL